MARRVIRASVRTVAACALIWSSAAGAVAKGPNQAVVTGPGIEQPIVVQAPGSPTIGRHLSLLMTSSGIMDQLWCRTCGDLSAKQPSNDLGPMYLIRYRVPSLIGGPARWVEQQVYPFAEPHPLTYVAPGQRFWHQRTAGGWFEFGARTRALLVDIGVPRDPPSIAPVVGTGATAEVNSIALAMTGVGTVIVLAGIGGVILAGRAWARTRRSRAGIAS